MNMAREYEKASGEEEKDRIDFDCGNSAAAAHENCKLEMGMNSAREHRDNCSI